MLGNVEGRESIEGLRAMLGDTALPRESTTSGSRSTTTNVGAHATQALARLEARIAAQN